MFGLYQQWTCILLRELVYYCSALQHFFEAQKVKIRRITLKNIKSYKDETTFSFDDRLNILIGPNGGGKSNLQKIIALILSTYFIHQYDFKEDGDEARIEQINLWNPRVLRQNLDRYFGDESDQVITLELIPEASDIRNIKLIAENLDKFNEQLAYWESPRESYSPIEYIDELEAADSFTYRLVNLEFEEVEKEGPSSAFREYLRTFFIFMRLSAHVADVDLTSPVFFFFSERATGRSSFIQSNQITENNYFSGYRSVYQAAMGESTNLLQWGTQHFIKIYWKALNEAGQRKDATAHELMVQNPDVKVLHKYLSKLGYEWQIATDFEQVSYSIALMKGEHAITSDKFSSGEREIVHFLLAMFALNVTDGLILVDEPELHLHPRWQRIFLGLFRDIAPERNNQFVISTHSPVFVTQDTINTITRIYGSENGSKKVALVDVELPEKRSLVRMINSQNNERIFFADKVILVEGITDRLVISSLVEAATERFSKNEAIEIIEVGGKHSFIQYQKLLNALETPSSVIADQDYLREVGSKKVKDLFVKDGGKALKSLTKGKKSADAAKLMQLLGEAIKSGDTAKLKNFLEYIQSRHLKLKAGLTKEEEEVLSDELNAMREANVWILSQGEIEAYLPGGVSQLSEIIELLEDRNWIVQLENVDRRRELIEMTCSVVRAEAEQSRELLDDVVRGNAPFRATSERVQKV